MLTTNDINLIRNVIKEETPIIVDHSLVPIKKDLKKIRKDLEFAVGVLDKDRWKLEKRIDRIEDHLHLPQT
jgi:hypothetical protein